MMPIRLTRAVKGLLIACVAGFVIELLDQHVLHLNFLYQFGLVPAGFVNSMKFWQLFTYVFLHGDAMHLVLNMLMLVFVGVELEALWGSGRFLRYFFTCTTAAGLLYLLLQVLVLRGEGLQTPLIGASGGIYGLLMAYGLLFSERVLLFMMLFPMKAKHFTWILAGVEFLTSISSGRGGLASAAHLGGMAAGFASLWIRASYQIAKRNREQKKTTSTKAKRRKGGGHLKLIIDNDGQPEGNPPGDGVGRGPKTWH